MLNYISQRTQLIQSYYSGIGKSGVIFPAAFTVSVALGLVNLGLVFYVTERFEASATQVGWLAATWSLCYVIGCLLVRPRFDQVLPRYLTVGACFFLALFTVAIHTVPAPQGLALVFPLVGAGGLALSFFWPPLMGWLSTNTEGAALGRLFSRYNVFWSTGMIISPFLAGWLSDIHVRLPMLLGSSLYLLTSVFLAGAALTLPRIRSDRQTGTANDENSDSGAQSTPLRFPAWLGLFASFFSMGVLVAVFPVAARSELDFSKSLIGFILLIRSLTNTVAFVGLGKADFWHFRCTPMVVGQLAGAVAMALLGVTQAPGVIMLMAGLFGITMALSYSNSVFHGVSGSMNRAGRMAIHESVLALGLVTGSALGGMIYDMAGMTVLFLTCGMILAAVAFLQSMLCMLSRKKAYSISEGTSE